MHRLLLFIVLPLSILSLITGRAGVASLTSSLSLVGGVGIGASRAIDSIFVNAPSDVLPLLTRNSRMDMIDYLDYSQPAIVTNRFGGKSEMTMLTDSLIQIRMTDVSTWQMRLLTPPQTPDTIIEVTHTVCRPDSETVVTRYSRDWTPLKVVSMN